MGDDTLGELLPWLLETLQSESSAVDRSGAAQGLSEVLLAQGYDRLAQLMPRFLESSQDLSNPTHIRDGYLMLFIYLPIAFGNEFTPFLAELLPCILKVSQDAHVINISSCKVVRLDMFLRKYIFSARVHYIRTSYFDWYHSSPCPSPLPPPSPPPFFLQFKGLADESEYIRDTSLQAGQTVVNRYGDTAVELFLPELERGLFDGKWRIRYTCILLK